MGITQSHQPEPGSPVPVMLMPQPVDEDEVNLLDLWCVLRRRKWIIMAVAGMATVAGLIYALLAPPVYKAEAWLLPPLAENVQGLNVQGLNVQGLSVQEFTPKRVYALFEMNLKSRALRRRFFDVHKVGDQLVPDRGTKVRMNIIFDKQFNKNLKVTRVRKDNTVIVVNFEGRNPQSAVEWVNGFIAMARHETVRELTGDITHRIVLAKQSISRQIFSKRDLARKRKLDRIDRLQVALAIASGMNLVENRIQFGFGGRLQTGNIGTGALPLYLLGSKALRAELGWLKKRTNDDPFIPDLRNLEERLAWLGNIHVNPAKIRVARLDQAAIAPDHPIKPRRRLIVLVALFGGLMLGVFAAFFAEVLAKARVELSTTEVDA